MHNIQSIFIISGGGDTIFTHEKFTQGSDEMRQMLFQRFILAFQNFISEMGSDETNIVLGKSKISSIYDTSLKVYFVLKSNLEANTKQMKATLKKIQLAFKRSLNEKKKTVAELDILFFDELRSSINRILEPKTNVEKFIEVLGF